MKFYVDSNHNHNQNITQLSPFASSSYWKHKSIEEKRKLKTARCLPKIPIMFQSPIDTSFFFFLSFRFEGHEWNKNSMISELLLGLQNEKSLALITHKIAGISWLRIAKIMKFISLKGSKKLARETFKKFSKQLITLSSAWSASNDKSRASNCRWKKAITGDEHTQR